MAWYPMLLHRTVLPLLDGAKHLRILGAGIGGIIWTAYLLSVCESHRVGNAIACFFLC